MRYEIDGQILTDIADSIREKTGKSSLIKAEDMAEEINSISGEEGDVLLITRAEWDALTVTQKRAYELVAVQESDSGYIRGLLYYGASYQFAKATEMTPVYAWNASVTGGMKYVFTGRTLEDQFANYYLAVMMQNASAAYSAYWTVSESLLPALARDDTDNDYAICYGKNTLSGNDFAQTFTGGNNWNNGEIACFAFSGDACPVIKELFYVKGEDGTYSYTYQASESEHLLLIIMRGGSGNRVDPTISGLTRISRTTSTGARYIDVYYGNVDDGDAVSISASYTVGTNNLGSLLVVLMSVQVEETQDGGGNV